MAETDYAKAIELVRAAAAQPGMLGDPMSYNFRDPRTWLKLAEMAGDAEFVVQTRSYIGSDEGKHHISQFETFRRVWQAHDSILEMAITNNDRDAVRWLFEQPGLNVRTPLSFNRPIFESCRAD